MSKRLQLGDCRRCFDPKPAVTVERFSFGGSAYNLALCDRCADRFLTDMFGWSRCGVLDEDVEPPRPRDSGRRGTVYKTHMHVPTARSEDAEVVEVVKVVEPNRPAKALSEQDLGLPAGWDTWRLTEHAMDRKDLRKVSPVEAMVAAQDPDIVRPGKMPGTFVHIKDHVHVVVNPAEHTIITVANRNLTPDGKEQELANAAS